MSALQLFLVDLDASITSPVGESVLNGAVARRRELVEKFDISGF